MKIKYRILDVDQKEHSIYVRYYTDIVSEDYLANEFDEDGNIKRDSEGIPIRCRTDTHLNIWQTPSPDEKELDKYITGYAPIEWLKLKEAILSPDVDTNLNSALSIKGKEKEFEPQEIIQSKELSDEEIDQLLEQLISKD